MQKAEVRARLCTNIRLKLGVGEKLASEFVLAIDNGEIENLSIIY